MNQPQEATRDGVLDAHKSLLSLTREIEDMVSGEPAVKPLLEHLDRLNQLLTQHFENEERGYLYAELPENHPRFANRLDALAAEHKSFLEVLNGITSTLREDEVVGNHGKQVAAFLAAIQRHEAEEREIIMSALWDDVGTGD